MPVIAEQSTVRRAAAALRTQLELRVRLVSSMSPRCISLGVLASGSLAGCSAGVLDPAGPVGASEKLILIDALVIMLGIVVPTMLCILAFAWWYRSTNTRAQYTPQWQYSGRLELIVWSIPALVVMFLGSIAWESSHELDPSKPLSSKAPLEVEVVSLDWKWLFIYPKQQVASINRLVIPVGMPVHFRLTSASVFNVFFVPQLGSEIYAMNGMATELHLQADRPGKFLGVAAHFSGDGFSDMDFEADALSADQFAQWVAAAQEGGPPLDELAYRALLKQSSNVQPYTYRDITPGLFDAIVRHRLPPGAGPDTARVAEK